MAHHGKVLCTAWHGIPNYRLLAFTITTDCLVLTIRTRFSLITDTEEIGGQYVNGNRHDGLQVVVQAIVSSTPRH